MRGATAAFAACAVAAPLGGCVSLLPKQKPVQLYVFGRTAVPASAAPSPSVVGRGGALGVTLAQVGFPRAALGDGVLTVRGEEAAYIDGARWLGPAVVLFQEAAERAFDAHGGAVRLVDRGQLGAASAMLRLDVREFDARYTPSGDGPPTVVVDVRATLTRTDGRDLVQQSFTAARPASEDRVSAIVAAYDEAVKTALSQVANWTDAEAPALAALPDQAPASQAKP